MSITIKVMGLHPAHGEVYYYTTFVVKFVSDLQQVGCFLQVVFNQSDFLHQ